MTDSVPDRPAPRDLGSLQPCAESCSAFRPLAPDRWSDYGLCLNPRAPRRGYPVRIGHECRHYSPPGGPAAVSPAT